MAILNTEPDTPTVESVDLELAAIVRRQLWIGVTTALACVLLLTLLYMDHRGWVIVAMVLMISAKKALVRYRALGKRKAELVQKIQGR